MNTITEFVCISEIVTYARSTSSALGQLLPCFALIKENKSRVSKISNHFDLHKLPMLLLKANLNPCDPWIFQLNGL